MKLDDTLLKILNTIRLEVKEKFGIDYDVEEIHDVVNTQIEATKLGFSRGITVHWLRFCKFIYTNKAGAQKEVKTLAGKLVVNEDLLPQEKETIIKQKIIDLAVLKRKKISEQSKNGGTKAITLEEILATPVQTPVNSKLFINITKAK